MKNEAKNLEFSIQPIAGNLSYVKIDVSPRIVNRVYKETVASQGKIINAPGFPKGTVPLEYVEQQLKSTLEDHLKEFLLNFWVLNFLFEELRRQKIVIAGYPRLHAIDIALPNRASFTFEVSVAPQFQLLEWHYFPFKSPKRKNYKDLDRQVELFLKEEKENLKQHASDGLAIGDWVHFTIALADSQNQILEDLPQETSWLKLGDEEADTALRDVFLEKQINDSFFSGDHALQEYYSSQLVTNYTFAITILDVVKNHYFCFEHYKKFFRLKSNKELQQKLIEVFSYRNDLSLRRSIAEESLKLLLAKHKFDVAEHIILRQQQSLLDTISSNPDYHVYRAQKDFHIRLRQLAERQAKEIILIDSISYSDDLEINDQDIKGYFNLLQRPRMKEFVYFDAPSTKQNGQEAPLSSSFLKQVALREKGLNHIIHHLTRQ